LRLGNEEANAMRLSSRPCLVGARRTKRWGSFRSGASVHQPRCVQVPRNILQNGAQAHEAWML